MNLLTSKEKKQERLRQEFQYLQDLFTYFGLDFYPTTSSVLELSVDSSKESVERIKRRAPILSTEFSYSKKRESVWINFLLSSVKHKERALEIVCERVAKELVLYFVPLESFLGSVVLESPNRCRYTILETRRTQALVLYTTSDTQARHLLRDFNLCEQVSENFDRQLAQQINRLLKEEKHETT